MQSRTNNIESHATRRLMRDHRELLTEPVDGVEAAPQPSNLLVWHVNLLPSDGPYKGLLIHLILTFPSDYPTRGPTAALCTPFAHPNVFGSYICLDLLKDPEYAGPYQGWSSAYTVRSILMQLSSFLFSENVPQEYGGFYSHKISTQSVERARETADNFSCRECKIHLEARERMLGEEKVSKKKNKKEKRVEAKKEGNSFCAMPYFRKMGRGVLLYILELLPDFRDVMALSNSCDFFGRFILRNQLLEKRQLMCFHSKLDFNDKETILGVGINVQSHPDKSIKELSVSLDYLSWHSYDKLNVRWNVWKEKFSHFLPLVINQQHAKMSSDLLESCLRQLCPYKQSLVGVILEVVPILMNSMIVSLPNPLQPFF